MPYFRSKAVEQAYADLRATGVLNDGCKLCEKQSIIEFTYWRVVPNRFPYDLIAKTHTMIIPKRHCVETELTKEELEELRIIKGTYINEHYQFVMEAVARRKSIPQHFHLHLIDPRNDLE